VELSTVTIHDLSRGGSGVARLESGEIVFVPFTAPGDEVRVRILDRKKNYCQGELVEVLHKSKDRVTPPCPHFTRCGGCSWQHLPYPLQFETKKKGLIHALGRSGVTTDAVPIDELPADHPYGYRNRIQLHGHSDEKILGFYQPGSKNLIDVSNCPIADERINERIPAFREEGFKNFRGEFKLELDLSPEGEVRPAWNRKNAAYGFRQVNDEQNLKLRAWVDTHTRKAETLLDIYGGTGNLSLGMAPRFKRVECIDLFTPRQNPPGTPTHFHFIRQAVEKWVQTPLSPESRDGSLAVVLDPPREGLARLAEPLCKKLDSTPVSSLILVGCEVDAFTRDSRHLLRQGYRLERLAVLDLFPQTPHVESLALFSR